MIYFQLKKEKQCPSDLYDIITSCSSSLFPSWLFCFNQLPVHWYACRLQNNHFIIYYVIRMVFADKTLAAKRFSIISFLNGKVDRFRQPYPTFCPFLCPFSVPFFFVYFTLPFSEWFNSFYLYYSLIKRERYNENVEKKKKRIRNRIKEIEDMR